MKSLLLTGIVALVLIAPASGHNTSWHWSAARAESKILTTGQAARAFSAAEITEADCVGTGKWIWSDGPSRIKLYKHFACYVAWTDSEEQGWEVERVLHVLGAQRFSISTT